MRREAITKVIKCTVVFIILMNVLAFLIRGSLLHEHIRISDFGNLHFNLWNPEKLWLNILFLLVELAALLVCLLYFRVYRDEASIMSLGFLSPTKETVGIGALLGLLVPSIWFLVVYISADAFVLSTNGISLLYLFQLTIVFILVCCCRGGSI